MSPARNPSSLLVLLAVALMGCGAGRSVRKSDEAGDLAARRSRMVADLAALRFERLGNPVLRWDHIPPVRASAERPHELLVVMVEYPDKTFDRFRGEADQGERLAAWYQERLFDPAYKRPGSLSHYYWKQSLGRYHLQGKVLPPVTLSRPRAHYGLPRRPEGGGWRNDSDPEGMVEEAIGLVAAAYPDLDWASFDRWDPRDHDGDGRLDEADGYLDHFVIVFAGGGQASCQRLFKLAETLQNPNVGPEHLAELDPGERECAERMWPHRFMVQKREGQGPKLAGGINPRGGVPIRDDLWGRDYNMQSEYTDLSTFAHEFGHSIGLPDVYSRTSSNSSGAWEVMSHNASPLPQNLSAWSRMQLGWLKPRVVVPPSLGGQQRTVAHLMTLDDPTGEADRAVLVALPPKVRKLELTTVPGGTGFYSGQGNELNRSFEVALDLRDVSAPITLSFDAWWEIEAGWDFAYVEGSTDGGRSWTRLLPADRRFMPAKHGHDGPKTLPGFTGLSGDMDGDGKNESKPGCDPAAELAHGEDKAGEAESPCLEPTWVHPSFDLAGLAGKQAIVRLRYFTDMAAVERGILVDNLRVSGVKEGAGEPTAILDEDFDGKLSAAITSKGFSPSTGSHTLLVPHYYLLEYRDPYAPAAEVDYRYDSALGRERYLFLQDPSSGEMRAMGFRERPGVVAWYFDGAFAWSENDPATNGQGKGYLLPLDSLPNEIPLPGLEPYLKGDPAAFDTHYELKSPAEQAMLKDAWTRTVCFVRDERYRQRDMALATPGATCASPKAPLGELSVDGKRFMYTYEIMNEVLPGSAREALRPAGGLYDFKQHKGELIWRLRDRSLRFLQTFDSPFALEDFAGATKVYDIEDGGLVERSSRSAPAVSRFDDKTPARWANPSLYFGGVAVPQEGFGFELKQPSADAPAGTKVDVELRWGP